jgi:hypothetical protein
LYHPTPLMSSGAVSRWRVCCGCDQSCSPCSC